MTRQYFWDEEKIYIVLKIQFQLNIPMGMRLSRDFLMLCAVQRIEVLFRAN